MKVTLTFCLTAFAGFSGALTVDFGDLDQYDNRVQNPPTLGGNTMWFSATEDEGFQILFSSSTQSKIAEILSTCGDTTDNANNCLATIYDSLEKVFVVMDTKIDRIELAGLLSQTFKGYMCVRNMKFTTSCALYLLSKAKAEGWNGGGLFIPMSIASVAAAVADTAGSEAITLSAAGSAVATVTLPPVRTATLAGSVVSHLTTLAADRNDRKKGDPVAIMDADLARRISELVYDTELCEDGRKLDKANPNQGDETAGTTSRVLCAAQNVMMNLGEDGPLGDLRMLLEKQMRMKMKESPEEKEEL